jgi:broad specificity phosphatase PhoE
MATKIILIRHGSTNFNSDEDRGNKVRDRGWIDVPLSPKGVGDVTKTANDLKRADFDGIIASDLSRATHSAGIVSEVTGVPLLGVTRGLRTWNIGDCAGKPSDDNREMLRAHVLERPDAAPNGGESFREFCDRVLSVIDDIRRKHDGKTIAIVTHGRCERLLAAWKAAGGGADEALDAEVFLDKGICPGDYVRHTLAAAEPDDDDDDGAVPVQKRPAPKKKVVTARPAKPSGPAKASATSSAKIAANTPGAQAKVYKRPRPTKDGLVKRDPFDLKPAVPLKKGGDGLAKQDPFDLKPKVPITKTKPTWSSAIRGSILEA